MSEHREIKTACGNSILVDPEDYPEMSKYKWHLSHGYAKRNSVKSDRIEGARISIYMHTILNKTPNGKETDHANMNRLDNRKKNLRAASSSENSFNCLKPKRSISSSRFKGVSWAKHAKKWMVRISIGKKPKYLGYFDCELEAAKCYDVHAVRYYGEFANTNF